MKSEEDIDALAKKLLMDDAVTPSDAIWERLESQLPAQGKRYWPLFFVRAGIVGGTLLMLGIGVYYFWLPPTVQLANVPTKTSTAEVDSTSHVNKENKTELQSPHQNFTEVEKPGSGQEALKTLEETADVSENPYSNTTLKNPLKQESDRSQSEKSAITQIAQQRFESISNQAPAATTENAGRKSADQSNPPSTQEFAKDNSRNFATGMSIQPRPAHVSPPTWIAPHMTSTASSLPASKNFSGKGEAGTGHKTRWVLGAFSDVRSTSLKINQAQQGSGELADALSAAEIASANVGGGITFGYQLSQNWRITSGMAFAKWCRITKYPVTFSVSEDYLGFPTGADVSIPLEQTFISATGPQNVEVNVPSSVLLGISTNIPANINISQQLALEECHQLLQVPLLIEYQYKAGRLSYLPGAGLAYEHILKRSTQLLDASEPPYPGSVMPSEAYRRHFLSFMASIHAEFMVTTQLSLRAGVNYKKWITPLYQSDLIKTYPRLISIDAGIVYSFYRR